jgi:Tfp pilus assembly protein PilF
MRTRWLGAGLAAVLVCTTGCLSGGKTTDIFGRPVADAKSPEKLELPPKEGAKARLATAEMLEKSGKLLEATILYEGARALDPEYGQQVSRRLAVLYDCQGMFVQADAEYRKALETAPKDADLWNDYGYSHYCRGNWEQAEEALRHALASNPAHKRAWTNLGLTLAQAGRYEESFEAFTKVVPPAQAHCNVAFALATQGKTADAIHEYRKALQLAPDLKLAQAAVAKLQAPKGPKPASPEAKPEIPTIPADTAKEDAAAKRRAAEAMVPFEIP